MTPFRLREVSTKIGSGATPRGGKDVYLDTGEVALIRSQNVYNDRFERSGLAYIGPAHAAQLSNVEVRRGDVLLNITGDSVARVCQVPEDVLPARVNQHVAIIRPDPRRLDPRFLRFFLASPQFQAEMLALAAAGATRNALTKGMIESFDIPGLSIEAQREIASLLGALEDKIELNRRMNETLEAMARAIFKDWFVDFGPTRAKAEGRAPYLAPDLWTLFPDTLDYAEKPVGWSVQRFGDYFRLEKGLSYKGMLLSPDGVPMINLGCFLGKGRFDSGKLKGYLGKYRPRHTVRPGTLVLANTDVTQNRVVIGSPHIVEGRDGREELIFSHHVFAARPTTEDFERWVLFFYFHLLRPQFRERAEGFATGTTVLALPKDAVEGSCFVMPGERVYERFLELVRPLLHRRSANDRENQNLAQTRDLLLPKLMSGEIRLHEAEKAVEAVP